MLLSSTSVAVSAGIISFSVKQNMNKDHNKTLSVLIVDDEDLNLRATRTLLLSEGIDNVAMLSDSRQVLPFLENQDVDVLLLDILMPHINGETLLQEIRDRYPDILIIILTVVDDFQMGINCMKYGAFDYLLKPVNSQHLLNTVKRALQQQSLKHAADSLEQPGKNASAGNSVFSRIITVNKKMLAIFKYIEAIAASDQPVIIHGETGTGKKLIAGAVHAASDISGSMVSVHVAGLSDEHFSQLLFGGEFGQAAVEFYPAKAVEDSGGTLFLDEIGELSAASQLKLLHFLQNDESSVAGEVRRHTRLVCATSKDLRKMIQQGCFRSDLYYRLGAHKIELPPLRERPEDIPLLVHYFIEKAAKKLSQKSPLPSPELFTLLSTYYFPGNVRELQAMVRDGVSLSRGNRLAMKSFEENIKAERKAFATGLDQDFPLFKDGSFPTLNEGVNFLIDEAMERAKQNQRVAAGFLGISRQALNRRLRTRGDLGKKIKE